MSSTTQIRTLVVTLIAGLVAPVAVAAQEVYTKSAPTRSPAERLEAIAFQPKAVASDWNESARALEQAARIRTTDDVQAVADLFVAAGAYRMAGNITRARWAAQDAARRAFKVGDVYAAATAHIAAVQLSRELNDPDGAALNLQHAQQLAESPRLTPTQKRSILKQLGHAVDPGCEK